MQGAFYTPITHPVAYITHNDCYDTYGHPPGCFCTIDLIVRHVL